MKLHRHSLNDSYWSRSPDLGGTVEFCDGSYNLLRRSSRRSKQQGKQAEAQQKTYSPPPSVRRDTLSTPFARKNVLLNELLCLSKIVVIAQC